VSITFPYQYFRVPHPLIALGGRVTRPRPVIPVTVIAPNNTRLVEGLLDSGADDTVFSDSLAALLGLDLSAAPTVTCVGVGGVPLVVRLAQVRLRIADNQEQREWEAWVGFTSAPLRRPLLGYTGFLQFFTAAFHGDRELVELTVNSAYAGS
jgi:hypothetical protein